ncbi:MAG TPA: hypothetical protein VK324_14330 [Tepidisphaeraceae bacterium]|nr:hypothetical protein [Tepidisphaeraceae bacterium]
MSDDESVRLATIQSMAERRTEVIDPEQVKRIASRLIRVDGQVYADQSPVLAALLVGPYWLMAKAGYTFDSNPLLVAYLLTICGATMPAAVAAGMVYRTTRLFELRRIRRASLAALTVFGSGLIAYATVLNEHAPAAGLLLVATACLVHITTGNRKLNAAVWLMLAGLAAALAATIDIAAAPFFVLMACVIPTLRWSATARITGVLAYLVGAVPAVAFYLALTMPVTGDWRYGALHPEFAVAPPPPAVAPVVPPWDLEDDDPGPLAAAGRALFRVWTATGGTHGLFSHFPITLLGILGISMVMHRHWPTPTKVLAGASGVGALIVLLTYATSQPDWPAAMFAVRWFVVFAPLLVLWVGAWLRKGHRPVSWTLAGIAAVFSVLVSLIGAAAGPLQPGGFDGYTAADAAAKVFSDAGAPPDTSAVARR